MNHQRRILLPVLPLHLILATIVRVAANMKVGFGFPSTAGLRCGDRDYASAKDFTYLMR